MKRTPLLLLATIALILTIPQAAHAGSYWASMDVDRGEIRQGVNGFAFLTHGGPWNTYGSHCDALPGTFAQGAYCKLRFTVPAGLTAGNATTGGGIARGDFRTRHDAFLLRSERPGASPSYVNDSAGDGTFGHGWGTIGPYFDIGLVTSAPASTGSITNWFHVNRFDVLLHDPSVPAIQSVSVPGAAGWLGAGCNAATYTWADHGSQLHNASLTNLTTGAQIHSWRAPASANVVQSGVPTAAPSTCITAPGSGTYTFRTAASDRSGNPAHHDFTLRFDVTTPTVSAPQHEGSPLLDGTQLGSRSEYRPPITWTVADAHSNIASIATSFSGTPVVHHRSGGTVILMPQSDLPLGEHLLSLTATDHAGNRSTVTRRVTIADTTAPTITVHQPAAIGGTSPLLDAEAADDKTGVNPTTWRVRVNGDSVAASSTSGRLQLELGQLVAGTHTILVTVDDMAGNTATRAIRYTVASTTSTLPGINGIYVLASPATVTSGVMTRIRAAAVRNGRPLAGMRAELHQGAVTVAGKPIASDGTVDIAVTLTGPGPLTLTVNGSGLPNQTIRFAFQPAPGTAVSKPRPLVVARVLSGDTIKLRDGRTIRLLQIDAPEATECYGGRATRDLRRLLRPGTRITISADRRLPRTARGQLLRYVTVRGRNLNRLLVQRGIALPHFAQNKRGRLAASLLTDARNARRADRGMWRSCDRVRITPSAGAQTGPA